MRRSAELCVCSAVVLIGFHLVQLVTKAPDKCERLSQHNLTHQHTNTNFDNKFGYAPRFQLGSGLSQAYGQVSTLREATLLHMQPETGCVLQSNVITRALYNVSTSAS